jgi:hypothetical protein
VTDPVVPHDLEAEKAVLGGILIENKHLEATTALLPSDFFRDAHRRIFGKMLLLQARNAPIDLLTLKSELAAAGELEEVGGPVYIASLTDGVPRSANVAHYAAIVKQHARAATVVAYARQAIETFSSDPAALANGAGGRFAEAFRRITDEAHRDGGRTASPLLDDVAVLASPDLEPIISGLCFKRTLMAVVGPPAIGKTSVGMDIGLSIAAHRDQCLGAAIKAHGPVIHIVAEGATAHRIGAWKIAHGYDLNVAVGFHTWIGAVNLLDPAAVSRFIAEAKPLQPIAVIWDTFSRCFVGGDENSAKDVGLAVASLDRARVDLDALQIVLHHMNAAGNRERGSTVLRGACDTVLYLQRADDLLQLTCDKQKDDEPFQPIDLALVPAYPGAKARVVRLASEVASGGSELSDAQGKALHALVELFGDLGATSKEWEDAIPAMHRATFYRARRVLLDSGYVRMDNGSKRFYPTGKTTVARCRTAVAADSDPVVAPVAEAVA